MELINFQAEPVFKEKFNFLELNDICASLKLLCQPGWHRKPANVSRRSAS